MSNAPHPSITTTQDAPLGPQLRMSDLPSRRESRFEITPSDTALVPLAQRLELLGLRKLRFEGRLSPKGKSDWHLTARLEATVVQPCVVTLAPVTTRISEKVERHYLATPDPIGEANAEGEVAMPEDDTREPLGEIIDLADLLAESLALALPAYPRADGAELGTKVFAAPDATPLTDDAVKPFAGLAALRAKMDDPEGKLD